jgi:hypothetical protein
MYGRVETRVGMVVEAKELAERNDEAVPQRRLRTNCEVISRLESPTNVLAQDFRSLLHQSPGFFSGLRKDLPYS